MLYLLAIMSSQIASLSEYELDTTGLHGHETRTCVMKNKTLRKARELMENLSEEPSNPVSVLIAEARVLVLQMGKKEFARAADMDPHAMQNAERPDSHPQHDSMARVYQYLEKREQDGSCTREEQRLLAETRQEMLKLLVPEEDQEGRPFRDTVDGLYQTWRYQVGVEAFEEASALTNSAGRPIKDGMMWQRHAQGVLPEFDEVRTIATVLDRDISEAETIWSTQKREQLQEREIPEPLAQLMVRLQARIEGLRWSVQSLRFDAGLKTDPADAILHGEMPELDAIKGVLKTVFPKKSERDLFVKEWQDTYEAIAQQPTFKSEFLRIRDENGWNNKMISSLLGIQAPEERDDTYIANRTEVYRPSAELRRMIEGTELSTQAPAKAVVALVANPEKLVDGVPEDQHLETLFMNTVRKKFKRTGSALENSTIRHHRMYCGVEMSQLADVSGYTKRDLQLVEQGKATLSAHETSVLIRLIHDLAQPKIDHARSEIERLKRDPTNLTDGIALLAERMGGYIPLARVAHTDKKKSTFNLCTARLNQIANGTDVPSLPQIRHVIERAGSNLTPELEKDWYEQKAEFLKNDEHGDWENPLARALGIIIFSRSNNLKAFWSKYLAGDIAHPTLTRNVRQLNVEGPEIFWPSISRYLNVVGFDLDHPQRIWMQTLFENFQDLRTASYEADEEWLQELVHNALIGWRKKVKSNNMDPNDFEHKLGLTKVERGINVET